MRRPLVINLLLLMLLVSGCSRTVTTIPSYGSQLTVEVTFRGKIDVSKNRYFMIISTKEAFSYPILPPEGSTLDEFLEPGDDPVTGSKADYFTNYYSTWHSYIVLDNMGYFMAKGPFTPALTVTRETLGSLPFVSDYIYFSIKLDKLFGASVPDNIYFDIISADYPSSGQKYLKDRITPPSRSISKLSGSVLAKTDEHISNIDPGLDMIDWTVRVE